LCILPRSRTEALAYASRAVSARPLRDRVAPGASVRHGVHQISSLQGNSIGRAGEETMPCTNQKSVEISISKDFPRFNTHES